MTDVLVAGPEAAPAEETLLSVVYSSVATIAFGEADLATLLMASRMRNAERGLTGMLLYRDGQFMQTLEGPVEAVRTALVAIAADARHTDMRTLAAERIEARRFGSWAMGYRLVTADDVASVPGWYGSPEASDAGSERVSAERAGELLAWFRDH